MCSYEAGIEFFDFFMLGMGQVKRAVNVDIYAFRKVLKYIVVRKYNYA